MGYSIRDARWRRTLWRDRRDGTIVERERYDERDDPHETVNVAARPGNADVVRLLSAHLPPPIAAPRD